MRRPGLGLGRVEFLGIRGASSDRYFPGLLVHGGPLERDQLAVSHPAQARRYDECFSQARLTRRYDLSDFLRGVLECVRALHLGTIPRLHLISDLSVVRSKVPG